MYHVLIADDEEPVLESYGLLLKRDGGDCVLSSCARNGIDALDLLRSTKPDIAYIDINMPGMDGLEVIRRARSDCPDCIFILSTAYERFDLAQKAIPLGIHAYLVKPVTSRLFLASLEDAVKTISMREKNQSQTGITLMREKFLRYTAWETAAANQSDEYDALFDLKDKPGCVAFIWSDSQDEEKNACIHRELEKNWQIHSVDYLQTMLCLLPNCRDSAALERELRRLCPRIFGSSSSTCLSVCEYDSRETLPKALRRAFSDIREHKRHKDALVREQVRTRQLRRRMGMDNSDKARSLFADYWKDVIMTWGIDAARYKLTGLFTLLLDDLDDSCEDAEYSVPPFIPSQDIPRIETLEELETWSMQAFEVLREQAEHKFDIGISPPLRKALSELDRHFAEPVQLGEIAEAAGVSASYLSRLFAEQMGCSFSEYHTRLRMEKAEKLLSQKTLSIKETSQACGYSDPNYFAKIFKKQTGMSPSMYAEKHHE